LESYEILSEEQIFVKDALTSPVITVKENACIPLVARLMEHYQIGSIVVLARDGNPSGIITERDLVVRILTKLSDERFIRQVLEIAPHTNMLTARDVMTSPLIAVTPDINLVEAARLMRRQNIRRLGVVSNGQLIGIISNKDILVITPDLIEILREKKKIVSDSFVDSLTQIGITGYCENCGNWSNSLTGANGSLLCEECLT
jgi:CBS domain-containing protein